VRCGGLGPPPSLTDFVNDRTAPIPAEPSPEHRGSYLRAGHSPVETVTRTGPAYVESESELFADIDRKRANGDITAATADAFVELYEFATEIGDEVSIGEAKNANFQMKVDAHQAGYRNDPSVFTANVGGTLILLAITT
jgi:hypothetical protein